MEHAQEILVIIVSTFLSLFLLVSIILVVLLIKVALIVKRVTSKAEDLAGKAEALGDFVQHATTPLMIGRMITTMFDKFTSSTPKKRKK